MNQVDDKKVVIGAGPYNNNPGWYHTQEDELDLLKEETWQQRFTPSTLSAVLAEHVWEHLTYEEGVKAAQVCKKYLKENGYIRCAVPDGFFKDEKYQRIVQVGGPGSLDHPAASHKIVHTYISLSRLFEEAGFEVKLLEYCDENGSFRENEWSGEDGVIFRSSKYDPRNEEALTVPSLIVDAIKREDSQRI